MNSLLFGLVDAQANSVLPIVLIQLAVIMVAARLFAIAFRWLGQPTVVGEIAAGLVLGPSALAKLLPDLWGKVFDPSVGPIFEVFSQLGLIFLLFLVGLEFDFDHLRARGQSVLFISVIGIVVPFALGWVLAQLFYPRLERPVDPRGFALFMGTAMSITALPVLGRIMLELRITRTRLGAITITAAAIDDAAGWTILAAISALVRADFDPLLSLRMIVETVGFALGMIFVARPLLHRWIGHALRRGDGDLGPTSLAVLLIVIFLCAIATHLIGIFGIFGAFVLGAVLSREHDFRIAVTRQLRNFVTVFFLPIFFTYTGLRTDIGTLQPELWLFAALVLLVAVLGKFGGCSLAAWTSGFSTRESASIGILMNTRGLMELVVVNVGYELGVIPRSVFCMLVIMALLTTIMTTPILLRLAPGTELESFVAEADLAKPRGSPEHQRDSEDAPV